MKVIIICVISIFFINCGSKKNKTMVEIPENYKTWKKPVKEILDYQIPGHGKGFRVIYANNKTFSPEITKAANGNRRIVFPDGSMIIKEVYKNKNDIGSKKLTLTIMKKDTKNIDALKGWIYIVKKQGKLQKIIKGRMCVGCHESANEKHPYFDKNLNGEFRDYLFAPIVK